MGDKQTFLRDLDDLKHIIQDNRWILGGDFNMTLSLSEKRGGIRRLDQDSEGFQTFIDSLKLVDLENKNEIFTWTNQCSGTQQVSCWLDRFLVSKNFFLEGHIFNSNILHIA
jgi:hypothetical protein